MELLLVLLLGLEGSERTGIRSWLLGLRRLDLHRLSDWLFLFLRDLASPVFGYRDLLGLIVLGRCHLLWLGGRLLAILAGLFLLLGLSPPDVSFSSPLLLGVFFQTSHHVVFELVGSLWGQLV